MNLNCYITFLLNINLIAIVVTRNSLNFTFLTENLASIANASNDSSMEPAALFEYQFMCVVARDNSEVEENRLSSPYTINEVNAENLMCGGAIIHEDWVLTVARCLKKGLNLAELRIYAGIVDMYRLEGQQVRSVKSLSIHPRFNKSSDEYNIAILKVSQSFVLTKYVNRVRLSSKPMIPSGLEGCYTLKFIKGMNTIDPTMSRLYKIQRRILAKPECNSRLKILKAFHILSKNNFCFVSDNIVFKFQLHGACGPDVGNPCICGYNLQGLISFTSTNTCYLNTYPTTVSDIGCHLNWIRSQILQLKYVPKSSSSKITVTYFVILLSFTLSIFN